MQPESGAKHPLPARPLALFLQLFSFQSHRLKQHTTHQNRFRARQKKQPDRQAQAYMLHTHYFLEVFPRTCWQATKPAYAFGAPNRQTAHHKVAIRHERRLKTGTSQRH